MRNLSISTNPPNSTMRTHDYRQSNDSNISTKKNPLKIYNSLYHGFDYEYHAKQKRNLVEMIADGSTPSNVSERSVIIHNEVYLVIPVVRELLYFAECKDENTISRQELVCLFKKLRIAQTYSDPKKIFKAFQFKNNLMPVEDFFNFFTSDIKTLDYKELTLEELILKFGTEIYRAVGKESITIEIKDVISYLKEHKSLGFDLTQMFELFDFYKSEISGTLKNKLTILGFFSKNSPILDQVFTPELVQRLQQMTKTNRTDQLNNTQQQVSSNQIKLYDPEKGSLTVNNQNLNLKMTQSIVQSKHTQNNTNFNRVLNERDLKQDSDELSLADVFYEVQPKNKGWIMRKSKKYDNKWAMVFCEISEKIFFSVKPTTLKKSIDIRNIEIHRCNFLELIDKVDFTSAGGESRKGHRRLGSYGLKAERGGSNEKFATTSRQGTQQMTTQQGASKLDFCFFILDTKSQKNYLIRSPENMLIGTIIHFYLHKEKYFSLYGEILSPVLCSEPEYSGVIETAACRKKNIDKYHSTLKSYSFKKQLLIIKNGKFNIYEMKVKDNLKISELAVKAEERLDIIPQTNPFIFTLEKDVPKNRETTNSNYLRGSIIEEEYGRFDYTTKGPGLSNQNAVINSPKQLNSPLSMEKKGAMSSIQSFFQSLVGGKKDKKQEKVTLACDTEMKKKQWMLTLNYYITCYTKSLAHVKPFNPKESVLQTYEDSGANPYGVTYGNNKGSFHTEFDRAPKTEKRKKKNKPSITLKNNHQNNPDFYDVYGNENCKEKENVQTQPVDRETGSERQNMPLITEPDANNPLDSDEILLTFTQFNAENLPLFLKNNPNAGQVNFDDPKYLFSNEIKTLTEVELWQKFILFFLKENHACSSFDLHQEKEAGNSKRSSVRKDRNNMSRLDFEAIEDEPLVRRVLTDSYNSNNKQPSLKRF